MQQRKLAGRDVSALGYGAMSFSNFYGEATEAGSHAILDLCRSSGITHIDTANVYGMGRSETWIGSYLAANPEARDTFFIATKAAIARRADGTRYFDNSLEHLEAELDGSLKRMGIDCVDLIYFHRRAPGVDAAEAAGTLARMVEKGKAKAIGFSEIAPTTLRLAHAEHPVAAVQSEYSLQTRSPEMGLVQTCAELDVALVAFSPVGRGLLTDRPHSRAKVETMDFLKTNERFTEPNLTRNIETLAPFRTLAADLGLSTAGLAIAWTLDQGDHVLPIPGTRHTDHLDEMVKGAHFEMTDDVRSEIDRVLPIGWCHGDRYNAGQWIGPEKYC